MKTTSLMAGASRFAHFTGLSRSARKGADEDQDPKGARAEDDDDDTSAEDDEPEKDDAKSKKGKKSRAADDDTEKGDDDDKSAKRGSKASDDDDEDEDEPKAKGKKSRRAAEDDDDEDAEEDDDKEEMTGRSAKAAARRRERARCAAIFAHKSAAHNVALAASLAFDTTMTRQEAIAVMRGQAANAPAPAAPTRSSREQRNPDLGASHGTEPGKKLGSSWGSTFTKLGVAPRG